MADTTKQADFYPARLRHVKKNTTTLAAAQPSTMEAFERFHQTAAATGVLDRRTKELIALAISVTHGCDDCIAHHVHDAIEAGATREELSEALGVAVLMGGGPGMIYASHAIEAVDQFLEGTSTAPRSRDDSLGVAEGAGMHELMKQCCGKDGQPDFEKMKQFVKSCGMEDLGDEHIAMMKEFCGQPGMPDMTRMRELMEKCGCKLS